MRDATAGLCYRRAVRIRFQTRSTKRLTTPTRCTGTLASGTILMQRRYGSFDGSVAGCAPRGRSSTVSMQCSEAWLRMQVWLTQRKVRVCLMPSAHAISNVGFPASIRWQPRWSRRTGAVRAPTAFMLCKTQTTHSGSRSTSPCCAVRLATCHTRNGPRRLQVGPSFLAGSILFVFGAAAGEWPAYFDGTWSVDAIDDLVNIPYVVRNLPFFSIFCSWSP